MPYSKSCKITVDICEKIGVDVGQNLVKAQQYKGIVYVKPNLPKCPKSVAEKLKNICDGKNIIYRGAIK
jgi:hypothetical protein